MAEEILVNVTSTETRVAVIENGVAQDVYIERSANRGTVGNIYAGKVVRVLPGMQAAFIDIGTERAGFIHVADIVLADSNHGEERNHAGDAIRDHLREGEQVIVQVTKDPLGSKGARLSTALSVSARYLVFMHHTGHVGISQRIGDAEERQRLQQVLAQALALEAMEGSGGYILRTAAEGVGLEEIRVDLRFLKRLWSGIQRRVKAATGPGLIHEDLPLQLRTVRDFTRPGVDRIRIDSRTSFDALAGFCREYVPEVAHLLEHYDGERPLFDLHSVEEEIQRALARKVALKSGGYLIIDQTESMTTIDVNTGSYVGRRNLAETVYKTNLEAATALARQLRLRNLGGIIIVDFIDMEIPEHRRQVLRTLENAMLRDPARNTIDSQTPLGLVAMTRKRTRESLERILCADCPVCEGRGVLKSAETICNEIFREISRNARACDSAGLVVLAVQAVVDRLLEAESANIADLEGLIGTSISFRVEPGYAQEHFDILVL